ncbi:deferrochelatase/peroxidase EfeB, partial [Streptomyces shenzhenensis]
MADQTTPSEVSAPEEPAAERNGTAAVLSRRKLLGTAGAAGVVLGAAGAAVGYTTAPAQATP